MSKMICIIFWSIIPLIISAQTDSTIITLNQCIEAALNNNPGIKEYGNEVSISEQAIKSARANLYPVLSAEASGGLSDEFHLGNNYKIGSASIAANQIIWQNGKIQASIVQAAYNFTATGFSLETRKRDLVLAVKTTYVNCLLQNQLYIIAQDNVSKSRLFLEYARERYKIGVARKSDVLKAEGDLSEAEFEYEAYGNSIGRARNELVMLTGLTYEYLSKLENNLRQEVEMYKSSDSLYIKAFSNYPDLQMLNSLGLSQKAKIRQVTAELYPALSFRSGYDWNYNPVLKEQKGWYSVLALRWDIFRGNERRHRIQAEQIQESVFKNQAEEVKNYLIKEIKNKLISLKEAEDQIILTDRLMKTTLENLEIAKAQYKAGNGSMLELTDAKINDLAAKQKNIRAIAAYHVALANLNRLTENNYANQDDKKSY